MNPSNPASIYYQIQPWDVKGHRFKVLLALKQAQSRPQVFCLPTWIPGSYMIREFSKDIESICAYYLVTQAKDIDEVLNPAGQGEWLQTAMQLRIKQLDKHRWEVQGLEQDQTAPGYLIVELTVYAYDVSVRRAYLDDQRGFFNGSSVFLAAKGYEDLPCLVNICAPENQRDWQVFTALPQAHGAPGCAPRFGFGLYQAPDYDALIDHPVEIGNPQLICFEAAGAPHELVLSGFIPHLDHERLKADLSAICNAQIELFDEPQFDEPHKTPFLDSSNRYVFLCRVSSDGFGGLEHRASTALLASRSNMPVKGLPTNDAYIDFLGLVSHEYFHSWHVKRIKPAAFVPYDLSQECYTRLLWVFEGFTSYYDDLMLVRAQTISEKDYLRKLGKTITQVLRHPGRQLQSISTSSFEAWTKYYRQDENSANSIVSYYDKGSLVALGLDLLIRQQSQQKHSLDDVMRLLWQRYGKNFYRGAARGVEEDAMAMLIQEASGVNVEAFIKRYVDGTEDVPLTELLAHAGIVVTLKKPNDKPTLDVKVAIAANHAELKLATVYRHGAAHLAGLSAGDILLAIDGLRVSSSNIDSILTRYSAGDEVSVHIFRHDELREYRLSLGSEAKTECQLSCATNASAEQLGMRTAWLGQSRPELKS